jgi:farnesyl diphosphate synthase
VIQKTELGQLLDLMSQPMGQHDELERFTAQRYQQIVKFKTSYYTFYLPMAVGMIAAGVTLPQIFESTERICSIMGEYFQVQDDYLDCYGKPEVMGKVGTDIPDFKITWLVVQALDRASDRQRLVLLQNNGKWDEKKVAKVKDLYDELQLTEVFHRYEEDSWRRVQAELDHLTAIPREVYDSLLRKIYRSNK